jgi:hypothetical protein
MGWVEDNVPIVGDIYKGVKNFVKGVVSVFTGGFGLDFDSPEYSSQQSEGIQGVLVNKDSAIADIPIVYGTRAVGGIRVFVSTDASTNEYLYVAYVLSEGQVNGYTKLIIDDNTVTIGDYSHGVRSFATSGNYGQESRLEVQFFDGRDDQIASTLLQEAPGWTSNHKLSGLAYIACKFRWKKIESDTDANNNPYGGGVPRLVVVLEGKKVFNVTTVTTGVPHTGSYSSDTKVFSDNPANILLDYMRNPRFGKGLGNETFDWDSFKTAATLCNQIVSYTSSTTGKAFTCNIVVDTGSTLMDNVKTILVGFRGIMPYQQGRYVLKIEHGGDDTDITATPVSPTVVFTATNDEIIGGITLEGDNKRTKINRCKVTYVDVDADYQPNEVIWPDDGSADDLAYLAEDDVRLEKDVTLNMITSRAQALQAAEVYVKRSRNFKQIAIATNMAGSNVTVGDLFRVINDRLGLDGVFRVVEIGINESGNIQISGFEHQSSAYAIDAKPADITRPTLNLPNPELVAAPTGVTATSGAAQNIATGGGYLDTDSTLRRIQVDWTASTDPFVRDYIVEYKLSTDATYDTAGITTRNQFHIGPVTLGAVYNIRVAARNELDRRSNFASASPHTVID